MIRATLLDAGLMKASLVNLLSSNPDVEYDQVLEKAIEKVCLNGGSSSKLQLGLRDPQEAASELFSRILDLRVVYPWRITFSGCSDPESRMEFIRTRIEMVISEVFGIRRVSDTAHESMSI